MVHRLGSASLLLLAIGFASVDASAAPTLDGTLRFGPSGSRDGAAASASPTLEGHVARNGTLRIDYDASRLPQCRDTNRAYSWELVGEYRFDDGPLSTFPITGAGEDVTRRPPTLVVPEGASKLELRFVNRDTDGGTHCRAVDDAGGAGYVFATEFAAPSPGPALHVDGTARFGHAGDPTLEGRVARGGLLAVDYDASRLPQCRDTNRAYSWELVGQYRFDGGPVSSFAVTGAGEDVTRREPVLVVPRTASEVEIWFVNRDTDGGTHCQAVDSKAGAHYVFATEFVPGFAAP